MKTIITSIAILFCATILFSQELETIKTYHDPYSKTKLASKYTVIKGTPTKQGKKEAWDEYGNLITVQHYKNNKLDGNEKSYENGVLYFDNNYKDGKKHGICTEYDYYDNYKRREEPIVIKRLWENGKLIEKEESLQGKVLNKVWYSDDGRSVYKFEKLFDNGKRGVYESFGWAKEYYPSGELYMEFECSEFNSDTDTPKPCGILRTFYKSGNLKLYKIFDKYQEQFIHEEFEDVKSEKTKELIKERHSLLFISENNQFQYLENENTTSTNVDIPTSISDFSYEEKVFYEALIGAPSYAFNNLIEKFTNSVWSDKNRILKIINMAKSTDKIEFEKKKENSYITLESYPNGQPKKVYKGSDFKQYTGTRKFIEYFENGNVSSKYSEIYLKIDYSGNNIHVYDSIINYYLNGRIESIGFYKIEKECPRNYSSDYYYEKDGIWKYYNEDGTLKEVESYNQIKVPAENRMCGYYYQTEQISMVPSEYLAYLEKNKKSDYKELVGKDKVLKKDITTFLDNLSSIKSTSNINILINFYESLDKINLISTPELLEKIHGMSDQEIITNLDLNI